MIITCFKNGDHVRLELQLRREKYFKMDTRRLLGGLYVI